MEKIKINTPYIKLDQLMKLSGIVTNGSDAKYDIKEGKVKVNGKIEDRRGRKLIIGDIVEYNGSKIIIE